MSLEHVGWIDLPDHVGPGGFDHAAVHSRSGLVYVAHTANDAVDVVDGVAGKLRYSIPDLRGVAGVLVSEARDRVFTSNRGENTLGIFAPGREGTIKKVAVGVRPNGLAFDPDWDLLLAANVGDPAVPGSFTVSIVDVENALRIAEIPVAGRTRWAVFDPESALFYVNVAEPPEIAVIDARDRRQLIDRLAVPAAGPHGLDFDAPAQRLFCACDGKRLIALDIRTGRVAAEAPLGGVPDVIWLNTALRHLYVAIGDPGLIEVFDTERLACLERVETEGGAHTLAFDPVRNTVYAFLPRTHRAAVYFDRPAAERP